MKKEKAEIKEKNLSVNFKTSKEIYLILDYFYYNFLSIAKAHYQ